MVGHGLFAGLLFSMWLLLPTSMKLIWAFVAVPLLLAAFLLMSFGFIGAFLSVPVFGLAILAFFMDPDGTAEEICEDLPIEAPPQSKRKRTQSELEYSERIKGTGPITIFGKCIECGLSPKSCTCV